jgi:hypothetical protein
VGYYSLLKEISGIVIMGINVTVNAVDATMVDTRA